MPLGRIYQPPPSMGGGTTVARNTPVYGHRGIKASTTVSNTDLVVTGKAVRNRTSKSPSPAISLQISRNIKEKSASPAVNLQISKNSRDKSVSPVVNSQISRNSKEKSLSPAAKRNTPSPVKNVTQKHHNTSKSNTRKSVTKEIIKDNGTSKENLMNNNVDESDVSEDINNSVEKSDIDNSIDFRKEKSWSPDKPIETNVESSDTSNNNLANNEKCSEDDNEEDEGSSRENNDTSLINGNHAAVQNGYSNGTEKDESPQRGNDSDSGCSGLRNIGNTCFMNSVIQCLSNTKQLTNYLLKDDHVREINTSNSSMKGSLIKAFATVIKSLWKGGGRVVDPSSLKGAVNRFAPRFSGYNQEDSQEFLRYLLEGLHEDVNRVLTKPQPINSEIDSSLSVCEQAMEAWKRYLRRDDSHLVDLFVGQLKSTLRCSDCGYESVTFEPFWDLSLGIPSKSGEVSLLDCFDSFTREEVLDGDEMPTCEQCKARKKCSKRYSLYRLPKILVIHLKRFSPTERFRQKLGTTVTFPLTGLSLSRYADSVSASCTYNCYAVSNHSGTLYSGHYTAYAKHPQSGQWYSFNDSRVSKCSSSSVMSNENYLLFFELS